METVKDIVRKRYETEDIGYRDIAKEYGKSYGYWSAIGRKEKWKKFKVGPKIVYEEIKNEEIKNEDIKNEDIKNLFTEVGKRKYLEIQFELGDLYTSLDEQMIFTYACAYQRALKLEKIVQHEGETIVSPATGGKYLNPSYSALLACNAQLIKIGNEFGFSIASRKRNTLDFAQKSTEPTIFDMIEEVINRDGDGKRDDRDW